MDDKETIIKVCIQKTRENIKRMGEELTDEYVMKNIEETVLFQTRETGMGYKEKRRIIERVFHATRTDLDILEPFIKDKTITEIMVNGPKKIFIEKDGRIIKSEERFIDEEELEEVIRRIAGKVRREINELNPIVDARLSDGSRANAILKNVALNGPMLTIRKFLFKEISMDDLIRLNTINQEAADFLKQMVQAKYNIFISGGTSSGKTTFLNALAHYIGRDERIITIEDSAELNIHDIDNLITMEARNANLQGKGEITMQELIKTSLRMRPDRIIVGEVRGKEAIDMLQAMNTGHDGSMCTGHANSSEGMISRLETMVLMGLDIPLDAIRKQILSAIDIIVHLGRLKDKSRRVLEIVELDTMKDGQIQLNRLFQFKKVVKENSFEEWGLMPTKHQLKRKEKLDMVKFHDENTR